MIAAGYPLLISLLKYRLVYSSEIYVTYAAPGVDRAIYTGLT